jgi:hypothetical protein
MAGKEVPHKKPAAIVIITAFWPAFSNVDASEFFLKGQHADFLSFLSLKIFEVSIIVLSVQGKEY